jgi:hypothetical protein
MKEYILTRGNENIRISPFGKSGPKIQYGKESGQSFKRFKLSGSLTLSGPDYTFLRSSLARCCGKLDFRVVDGDKEIIKAVVNPFNVEFDDSNCIGTINTFTPNDIVAVIMGNWNKEINVLDYNKTSELISFPSPKVGVAPQTRGRNFIKLFHYLLTKTVEGTEAESVVRIGSAGYSQFYEAEINPVTKLENNTLALVELSDAGKPGATNPAIKGLMTLKAFLAQIRMHNVYWDIDQYGFFRMEHKQFYDMGYSYVLPDLASIPDWRKYGKSQKFKYRSDEIYNVEQILFPNNEALQNNLKHIPGIGDDAGWPEWLRGGVRYVGCIPNTESGEGKTNDQSFDWITDYNLVAVKSVDPETRKEVERSGWVLVELVRDGSNYSILKTPGMIRGAELWNGNQSAANLFVMYHDWGRSFQSGFFNEESLGNAGTMRSVRYTIPNQVWDAITIPECDITTLKDFTQPIRTLMDENGLSYVDSAEWDFVKQQFSVVIATSGICAVSPGEWLGGINPTQPGCPAPGQFLRQEVGFSGICTILTDYFTDGKCGEVSYKRYIGNCGTNTGQ